MARTMHERWLTLVAFALLVTGCEGDVRGGDGVDGGRGMRDARVESDGAPPGDRGALDGPASVDGGGVLDGGALDGGMPRDAGGTDAGGDPPPCPDELAGTAPVEGPQGLMIQAHTMGDLCLLERALDHVCRAHRAAGAGILHDLVLTDAVTADAAGRPTETVNEAVLDRVLARRSCFDNLFVGTVPEVILADPYEPSTINDETSRWTWLYAAQRVADAVAAYMAREAAGTAWHWYVSYEANLNYFTDATYRSSYVALLDQHVRDVKVRRDTPAVFWSPTFWTDPGGLSASARASLRAALADLFSRVPGITWVAVQDHLGVDPAFSCADALVYHDLVRAAGPALASVQLNVEYFELAGGTRDGDPAELASRIRCYRDAGASLGASFELRYWYRTHGH